MCNEKHIAEIEGKLIRLRASENISRNEETRCYEKIDELAEERKVIFAEILEAVRELKLLKEAEIQNENTNTNQ